MQADPTSIYQLLQTLLPPPPTPEGRKGLFAEQHFRAGPWESGSTQLFPSDFYQPSPQWWPAAAGLFDPVTLDGSLGCLGDGCSKRRFQAAES